MSPGTTVLGEQVSRRLTIEGFTTGTAGALGPVIRGAGAVETDPENGPIPALTILERQHAMAEWERC